MNWIAAALSVYKSKDDILRLYKLLRPIAGAIVNVAPTAVPLAKQIMESVDPVLLGGEDKFVTPPITVEWIQETLNLLGEHLAVDGDPGDATKEAIKRFQRKHGLDVDGWCGIETTARLYHERQQISV